MIAVLKRLLKFILLAPPAVVLIILAVANRQDVVLSLDPFAPDQPAFALQAPLFWMLFGALFLGILLGGLGAWASQHHWRREARSKRREADYLRTEAERLKTTVSGSSAPGLPAPDNRHAA